MKVKRKFIIRKDWKRNLTLVSAFVSWMFVLGLTARANPAPLCGSIFNSIRVEAPWDKETEKNLMSGELAYASDLSTGSTRPIKVRVSGARSIFGIFKQGGSPRFEVAAYRLDLLLGLDLVPPTVLRFFRGKWGSLQYFVEAGKNPYLTQSAPSNEMNFFDYLIGNTDRNGDNFLILNDGNQIAIDHGNAFQTGGVDLPEWNFHRAMPSRAVFEKLKSLDDSILRYELGQLLSNSAIESLIFRKNRFIEQAKRLYSPLG